jgi:hypothetical protein
LQGSASPDCSASFNHKGSARMIFICWRYSRIPARPYIQIMHWLARIEKSMSGFQKGHLVCWIVWRWNSIADKPEESQTIRSTLANFAESSNSCQDLRSNWRRYAKRIWLRGDILLVKLWISKLTQYLPRQIQTLKVFLHSNLSHGWFTLGIDPDWKSQCLNRVSSVTFRYHRLLASWKCLSPFKFQSRKKNRCENACWWWLRSRSSIDIASKHPNPLIDSLMCLKSGSLAE